MKKSYRLSRGPIIVLLLLVVLLIGLFIRFLDLIQASIEEVSVQSSLLNMQQLMHFQGSFSETKNPECTFLNKSDLFQQFNVSSSDSSSVKNTPGSWVYDSKKHQLIYIVRSRSYFKSKHPQQMVIDLYCNQGNVIFKVDSFQWCHEKKIWGCTAW
ncbi:hypothetical protein [Legionella sainthelensi]|nr:hypothetical protein [Legionella sainthelensi]